MSLDRPPRLPYLITSFELRSWEVAAQPVRCHQFVGERMQKRDRLSLDQTANRDEAKAVVFEIGVDPLDELAPVVPFCARLCPHPAAPLFDAVRLSRPLFGPPDKRLGFDILTFARWRRIDRHRPRWVLRQGGDVLGGSVTAVDQKLLRWFAVALHQLIHHRHRQTGVVAPIRHRHRDNDALPGPDRGLCLIGRANNPRWKPDEGGLRTPWES